MKTLLALVGRPNVGKSTLFNRIIGQQLAVVSEVPGTTRDRLYAEAEWGAATFTIVDTGGMEFMEGWHTKPLSEDSERYLPAIRRQAEIAIQDADVIVQVVDGTAGITAADREIADILRQTQKPVFVAANKLDALQRWDEAAEFYELALGQVFPMSAVHGGGVAELLDAILEVLPLGEETEPDDRIKIALLGRPNTGKSTLLNRFLGEERVIVSDIPGTTRDAIDMPLTWEGQDFTLIDTAGIRRAGKIVPGVEKYSVLRSIKALQRADVVLLLLDATEGITAQDTHVAGMIQDEAKGVIVLVNKWDVVEKDTYTVDAYTADIRRQLNFLPYVPLLFISAKTGQRVDKILPLVLEIHEARHYRIPTSVLNRLMREALQRHAPTNTGAQRVKFLYASQVAVAPPTFIFFVNDPARVHFSYSRYLENRLREYYPFLGTPIRLVFRARQEKEP